MTSQNSDRHDIPEEYEQQLEDGLAALDTVPRDENWEHAQKILQDPPSRAAVEALAAQAAEAQAMIDSFEQARYIGRDEGESTAITLDATGQLERIEFDVPAAAMGNHALADAILAAWKSAEDQREQGGLKLIERAKKLGG